MRWFFGTIGILFATTLIQIGLHDLAEHTSAKAESLPALRQEVASQLKEDSEEMTFAKHLALNPEMFAGPVYRDDRPLDQEQQDLKGGALSDPKTVHAILFLKELGLRRLREQLTEPGLPASH